MVAAGFSLRQHRLKTYATNTLPDCQGYPHLNQV
jgi:hypothetical protein